MIPLALILPAIMPAIEAVIDRALPDEGAREKAKADAVAELSRSQQTVDLAMLQHPSWFIAGARPMMLWVAAVGLGYAFIGQPLLAWGLTIAAWWTHTDLPPLPPQLDITELLALGSMGGGLYALRGLEKAKGVARETMAPDPLAAWRAAR